MKSLKVLISVMMALVISLSFISVVFAENEVKSVTETESNNDVATATAISVGVEGIGKIDDENDLDYFKVPVADPGLATVTFSHNGGGTSYPYYEVSVVDSDNNPLCFFTVNGDDKTTDSPKFPLSSNDYYIVVKAGSVINSQDYSVKLTIATGEKAEAEPNNDISNSTEIAMPTSGVSSKYYGTIASSMDVDYYKFISPKGYFYVDLYNSNGAKGDYKVTVYAGVGTLYEAREIGEFILSTSKDEGSTCAISVDVGTYYAKVEGINGSTGGYQIQIETKADSNSETEYNNEKNFADQLAIDYTVYGNISFAADKDYYYIDQKTLASDKKYYQFKLEPGKLTNKSTTTWNITIYKKDGTVITTLNASDAAGVTYSLANVDTDTVIFCVEAGSNYGDGNYIITITQEKAPEEKKSLIDKIKSLDWKSLWNDNFASWIGNVEVKAMVKAMLQSFGNVIRGLIASRG